MDHMILYKKKDINQTNIKVVELINKVNFTDETSDPLIWEKLFNESMSINPNNASGTYADSLMNIKYILYQKASNNINQDNNDIIL